MKYHFALFALLVPAFAFANDNVADTSLPTTAETTLAPLYVKSELERSGLPLGFQPGSFVKKDQDEIKTPLSRSLRDVASDIPGVSFLGGPRTRAQLPQIRGLGSDRVLILEDGARQNFQSGHSGRVFSDVGSFEELEIVKGPLSSMFGSGALGGVINLRRPTARDFQRRTGRTQGGEIALDGSSVDDSFGQRYTLFGIFPGTEAATPTVEPIVSYSQSSANDILLGKGSRLNFSSHKTNELYAGLGVQLGKTKTNLKVTNYEDSGQAPLNAAEEASATNAVADTKNIKTDAVLSLAHEWESSSIDVKPFVRKSRVERVRTSDGRRDLLQVESVGLDGHYDFTTSLAARGRSVVGIEGFRDSNRGERAGVTYGLFPNGETLQYGLYLQQPIDLTSELSLIAGLRADQYKSSPGDTTLRGNEGSALSPKLYLVWEALKSVDTEHTYFVGWGRGFNAPRLQDLYVSGLHFPGQPGVPNNFFQANPDLKPETADSFEIGTRGRRTTWTYSLTGFLTEAKDFILRDVNITAGTTRLANIDRATLYGAELGIKNTFDQWTVGLTSAVVRGINRRSDAPLADTPADRARLTVDYAATDSWIVSADSEMTLGQERVPDGVTATGGSTVYNAGTSWAFAKDWSLTAKVTNIFNLAYHRHSSQIDDAGRDIRAAVTARF